MGFNTTLHPIAEAELKHYVFDIADHPELAGDRVKDITSDPERQAFLRDSVYAEFAKIKADREKGVRVYMGNSYTYAAAVIAGFLHPYFYSWGTCVAVLAANVKQEPWTTLIEGLAEMAPVRLRGCYDDRDCWLGGNFEGWGYVKYENLSRLKDNTFAPEYQETLHAWWPKKGKDIMLEVIEYCLEHQTGFLEATDVAVPFLGRIVSDEASLQVRFDQAIDFI
jgi:hypothetical protein